MLPNGLTGFLFKQLVAAQPRAGSGSPSVQSCCPSSLEQLPLAAKCVAHLTECRPRAVLRRLQEQAVFFGIFGSLADKSTGAVEYLLSNGRLTAAPDKAPAEANGGGSAEKAQKKEKGKAGAGAGADAGGLEKKKKKKSKGKEEEAKGHAVANGLTTTPADGAWHAIGYGAAAGGGWGKREGTGLNSLSVRGTSGRSCGLMVRPVVWGCG